MANSVTHAALPYPVKGCRFTLGIPYLDADGDPTDPTTPDTERSIDGASFADCTEEATTITGSNGSAYITLTGDEMNGSLIMVAAKVASGPKATLATLYPRVLPVIFSGTASAGAAGTITLVSPAPAVADILIGCIVRTTGGTGGGGGSGSLGNQARVITAYTSGRVATVVPNWETTPSTDTTYEVLLTAEGAIRLADVLGWNRTLVASPATAGVPEVNVKNINNVATTSVTTVNANQGTTQPVNFTGTGASALAKSDMVDVAGAAVSTSTAQIGVNAVNIGGTAQTGRDIGASVLLSSGTGTGQLDFTSGVVKANLAQILGTALTETAGQIAAAFKKFFDKAAPTGTINSIPDAVAGASGGLFIAGSNAATTANITGNLSGSVGSVTGAVGSVTGNVGGNVTGSVGSLATQAKADVNAEVDTAIADARLDEILAADSDIDGAAPPTVGSVIHELMSKTAGSFTYDQTTDSLEAIRDKETDIETDTQDIQSRLPAALVSGRIDASVGAMAANVLTASALATDAVNEIVDQVWDEAIADHAGAGSTGLALASATAPSAATVADAVWDEAIAGHLGAGSTGLALNGATAPSAATVADAVWDEAIAGHLSAGSTGLALNSAGSAGDPWGTALPGAYGAGTAGKIVGDNLNATVSSRSTLASGDIDTALNTYGALKPTTAGRTLDVTATGAAGVDWGNVENKTTANDLSATTISTSQAVASVSGAVGSVTAGVTVTTNNDKTGYGLSSAAVQAIWDALTSALTTVGSIGKKLADWTIGTAQTGDSFARLGAPVGASISADIAAVQADTDNLQTRIPAALVSGRMDSSVGAMAANTLTASALATDAVTEIQSGLSTLSAAQVNAEVVDALTTDTYAEPGAVPAATSSLKDKINWLFALARNKLTQTATTQTLRNDADSGDISSATVSDNGTTFTRGEWS